MYVFLDPTSLRSILPSSPATSRTKTSSISMFPWEVRKESTLINGVPIKVFGTGLPPNLVYDGVPTSTWPDMSRTTLFKKSPIEFSELPMAGLIETPCPLSVMMTFWTNALTRKFTTISSLLMRLSWPMVTFMLLSGKSTWLACFVRLAKIITSLCGFCDYYGKGYVSHVIRLRMMWGVKEGWWLRIARYILMMTMGIYIVVARNEYWVFT